MRPRTLVQKGVRKGVLALAASFALLAAERPAAAGEAEGTCSLYDEASPTQLLRRLSLDLRHRLPTYEEYEEVELTGALPEGVVDEYLESDEFRVAMRRFHEALLWPNVEAASLPVNTFRLRRDAATGIHYVAARTDDYRGGSQGERMCEDVEQKEFEGGAPVVSGTLEGWVWVKPYWSDEKVKVCAFDAQKAESAGGGACDSLRGGSQKGCGCGPELRFCYGPGVEQQIHDDMREQLLRLVDESTFYGRPYSEILTTRRAPTSGRLDYWRKHLAPIQRLQKVFTRYVKGDTPLAANPRYDGEWKWVERPAPHAGVLTLPAYTLRFQTNRGRANRFRVAFEGQYFEPPSADDTKGCDPDDADVTKRCVCRHCHTKLEPLASHFAGVAEGGSAIIESFDDYRKDCVGVNDPNSLCNRFYVTDPDAYRAGWRIPLQYADGKGAVHQAMKQNAEAGPIALAKDAIESGAFARATVLHLFEYLMGRPMNLDPSSEDSEQDKLDELTTELRSTDDFKLLVRSIVNLPAYRRMR